MMSMQDADNMTNDTSLSLHHKHKDYSTKGVIQSLDNGEMTIQLYAVTALQQREDRTMAMNRQLMTRLPHCHGNSMVRNMTDGTD